MIKLVIAMYRLRPIQPGLAVLPNALATWWLPIGIIPVGSVVQMGRVDKLLNDEILREKSPLAPEI